MALSDFRITLPVHLASAPRAADPLPLAQAQEADPLPLAQAQEADPLPRIGIHSRRYLGAKTRLLDYLEDIALENCGAYRSLADPFAGTGVVAHRFNRPDVKIIAADLLRSNVVALRCFLETSEADEERLTQLLLELRALPPAKTNYVSKHFGNRFFTRQNARRIGTIRQTIADWRGSSRISAAEEAVLLTSLLYATDRVANTCGHYDAYREKLDTTAELELALPDFDCAANQGNAVYQTDANRLVSEIEVDVLYLDPPYNSRQYSDTYHLLENLIRGENPPVFGKARKMDRRGLKSVYCSAAKASAAFSELIAQARCRHILFSYNNMSQKGDARSNACIPDDVIIKALEARGEVKVYERPFNHFTAGLREIDNHTERVFYCRVK